MSATDVDDKTFKGANRGKYVAIAAPGVDILVPAPEGGYQLTTGTSVAAAEISGVVALMLERNPQLKPAEVRNILSATAKDLGVSSSGLGAGVVDPIKALSKAGPKQARAMSSSPRPVSRGRSSRSVNPVGWPSAQLWTMIGKDDWCLVRPGSGPTRPIGSPRQWRKIGCPRRWPHGRSRLACLLLNACLEPFPTCADRIFREISRSLPWRK